MATNPTHGSTSISASSTGPTPPGTGNADVWKKILFWLLLNVLVALLVIVGSAIIGVRTGKYQNYSQSLTNGELFILVMAINAESIGEFGFGQNKGNRSYLLPLHVIILGIAMFFYVCISFKSPIFNMDEIYNWSFILFIPSLIICTATKF